MKLWKHALTLAAAAAFAWPMADGIAQAQRGERGGGDRGGQRSDGNRGGGERRGGGGDRGGQSLSGGQQRGNRGGESRRSPSESVQRSMQQPRQRAQSTQPQPSQRQLDSKSGRPSRSFYRGPDAQAQNRQQFSRSEARSNRGDVNRVDRSRSGFDDIDRRDRQRSDGDRNESRNRDQRDRGDRDFDRDRYDRDRANDWTRFGRDDWRNRAYDVRRNWSGWYGGYGVIPFRSGWYNNYLGNNWPVYSPYRYSRWSNRPNYWWGWTPAAQLTDWVVFGWDRPRYWGYGPNANIYYRDNYVYYDGRQQYTVDDYYQQVYDLAHSVPDISEQEAENMDWRPLGVFALTREGQSDSRRALQLAINRDGVLTGTYFNRENGHVHPVSGMVDDQTQRAAWAFADGEHKDVVFETSVYNLTRDQSTMMVHFGPQADGTEVWQLVRLEQPDENATARSGGTNERPTSSRSLP